MADFESISLWRGLVDTLFRKRRGERHQLHSIVTGKTPPSEPEKAAIRTALPIFAESLIHALENPGIARNSLIRRTFKVMHMLRDHVSTVDDVIGYHFDGMKETYSSIFMLLASKNITYWSGAIIPKSIGDWVRAHLIDRVEKYSAMLLEDNPSALASLFHSKSDADTRKVTLTLFTASHGFSKLGAVISSSMAGFVITHERNEILRHLGNEIDKSGDIKRCMSEYMGGSFPDLAPLHDIIRQLDEVADDLIEEILSIKPRFLDFVENEWGRIQRTPKSRIDTEGRDSVCAMFDAFFNSELMPTAGKFDAAIRLTEAIYDVCKPLCGPGPLSFV